MTRIRSISLGRRPLLLVLLAVGVLLLAAALLVEPASRRDSSGSTSGSDVATSTVPEGTIGTVPGDAVIGLEPESVPTDLDATEKTVESAAGRGADMSSAAAPVDGISADEAAAPSTVAPDVATTLDMPGLDARIIRTASMELSLRRGSFEESWSDAQAVAGAFGGYVVAASRSGGDRDARIGTMTMRVPSARFDAAVDRLRGLDRAKVERLDVASQDVTQEFVDVRSRLRHDRAVEARLLALLARTESVSEVLAVQARLDQVQEQIEVSRGRLQYLRKLTAMSTIELQLTERGARPADTARRDEQSVLGEAWDDAQERFAENVASAIVWAGGALPTLLALLGIGIVGRAVWRRHGARTASAGRADSTS